MNGFARSPDGVEIHFESQGTGPISLLFVHGWLGNLRWWDATCALLPPQQYQLVTMDLAGHGTSQGTRSKWSVQAFAEDIQAVADHLRLQDIVLIGHSMSGSNVVAAFPLLQNRVKAILLIDTLQDLDRMPTPAETAPLFEAMRKDFRGTLQAAVPNYMFLKTSPRNVIERITREMSDADPDTAIGSLQPFYATDMRPIASRVSVPVRGIMGELLPADPASNRKYFRDYDRQLLPGMGHYPMLEAPELFTSALQACLHGIGF